MFLCPMLGLGATGSGLPFATLFGVTVSDSVASPGTATAGYQLRSNKDIRKRDPSYSDIGDWTTFDASLFEHRCTIISGTLNAGSAAVGVWLDGGAGDYEWFKQRSAGGLASATLLIETRRKTETVAHTSATVTLEVEVVV